MQQISKKWLFGRLVQLQFPALLEKNNILLLLTVRYVQHLQAQKASLVFFHLKNQINKMQKKPEKKII